MKIYHGEWQTLDKPVCNFATNNKNLRSNSLKFWSSFDFLLGGSGGGPVDWECSDAFSSPKLAEVFSSRKRLGLNLGTFCILGSSLIRSGSPLILHNLLPITRDGVLFHLILSWNIIRVVLRRIIIIFNSFGNHTWQCNNSFWLNKLKIIKVMTFF